MTSSVDIVLGSTWKVSGRCHARLSGHKPGRHSFDFSTIYDIIDIVVDGSNLTSQLPEDSIFHVTNELVHGLLMLCEGRVNKHIIAFQEAPWELAIQSSNNHFELSLYGVGMTQEVAAHNLKVLSSRLIEVVCMAAERFLADLLELNPAFARDEAIDLLTKRTERLKGFRKQTYQTSESGESPKPPRPLRRVFGARPLSLEIDLDLAHEDLWRYQGAQQSDLHSLLFKGSLTLIYWGRRRVLAESTYVFPILNGLVSGVERLIRLLETGAGGAVLLDPDLAAPCLLTAEVIDAKHIQLRITQSGRSPGQTSTTPQRVVDAFLGLVEAVLEDIVALNPRQSLNHRIGDIRGRLRRLRARFIDLEQGDVLFEQVDGYLRKTPTVEPAESRLTQRGDLPVSIEDARHLFLRSTWLLVRNQINYRHICGVDDKLIVPSSSRVDVIDRGDGRAKWARSRAVFLGAESASLLLFSNGELSCFDTENWRARWEVELPSEPTEVCLCRAGDRAFAVVSVGDRSLNALDLRRGEQLWTFTVEHGELIGTLLAGPVLVVVTNDGFVQGICALEGRLLWKVRTPGGCVTAPQVHEGRLYIGVDSEPGYEGVLYGIHPLSGHKTLEARVPASFSERPLLAGATGFFPLEFPGGATILAMDLTTGEERWSHQVESAQVDAPALTLPQLHPSIPLVVKTDTGKCLGFEVEDGKPRWCVDLLDPGDVLLANLEPASLDGFIVVPERYISIIDPRDGRRLHRFEQLSEHPTFLHVDNDLRLLVGEGDDHLECHDLKGFLALV